MYNNIKKTRINIVNTFNFLHTLFLFIYGKRRINIFNLPKYSISANIIKLIFLSLAVFTSETSLASDSADNSVPRLVSDPYVWSEWETH